MGEIADFQRWLLQICGESGTVDEWRWAYTDGDDKGLLVTVGEQWLRLLEG